MAAFAVCCGELTVLNHLSILIRVPMVVQMEFLALVKDAFIFLVNQGHPDATLPESSLGLSSWPGV